MATIPPFVRLDPNKIPEDGPSLAAFPPPLLTMLDGGHPLVLVSGFSGAPNTVGDPVYRFGSLVKYSCSVSGLTAAAGTNVAQMGIPISRASGPFTRTTQAYGSLAALSNAGVLLTGNVQAVPGGDFLQLTLENNTGVPQSLATFELQMMVTYHLVG